jgi:hypothetical protein
LADLTPAWIPFQLSRLGGSAHARVLARQHVVSTVICLCSQASSAGGYFGVKQGRFFAEQALQPAHEPYRHIGTLPRSSGVAVAERVFPVLWRAWYRNAGATALSPVAAGNQVLALSPVAFAGYSGQFDGPMAAGMCLCRPGLEGWKAL